MDTPLYSPSAEHVAGTNLTRFTRELERRFAVELPDYQALYRFSIERMSDFWLSFWDFADLRAQARGERVLVEGDTMRDARFFPDARLNFADNLLRRRDDTEAIVFRAEDQVERRLTWRQLYREVARLVPILRAAGVQPGDRCAGFVPNMPEAIIAMLATTAIGAIWTSCSPDFGVRGVVDRFGQSRPKVLFTADGYFYAGKAHQSLAKVREFLPQLPSVEQVVIIPLLGQRADADTRAQLIADAPPRVAINSYDDLLGTQPGIDRDRDRDSDSDSHIDFAYLPFDHPVYIMYSSGTTGAPKCITHGAGGVLLTQLKEHLLHCDERPFDRVFYFTTCGWMMWNWLASALAVEATVILYDGSPFHPDGNVLFDYAQAERWTLFGTSAKYIDALAKADLTPRDSHDLSSLRLMTSTGSPLVPESFDYAYQRIKPDMQLASISGGTDILGCFMAGNPNGPVWRGEIQARCLGMAVEVYDDDGQPVRQRKGELVCVRPFPSMPVSFWGDDSGQKYHDAYFARFPGVWCHGDFIELTEHDGVIVYGRSDATLNPGGVRIGTAEIYRQVESLPEVIEAIAVGQEWDSDTRVVLFLRMAAGHELTDDLRTVIKKRIRANCTPRHVPAKILAVTDIPRTKSGKITELAVRDVIHGRPIKNREALANAEALDLYGNLPELQQP